MTDLQTAYAPVLAGRFLSDSHLAVVTSRGREVNIGIYRTDQECFGKLICILIRRIQDFQWQNMF